ncbi:heat shock protein Hsp20 [Perkinsela sp. CCAP 1560/4]|nr:heat shock protein Hsp20 [Perkinsela sp. CCAP 1560/4]|eukprot:KNH06984.1 heat shock protein Hsp20 [Perkinsela sp. CCAP 1560/4]
MFGGSNNKPPWDPLRELDELKKIFSGENRGALPGSMFTAGGSTTHPGLYMSASSTNWMPAVDLLDTPQKYVLTAEMPGVNRENIEIDVSENRICVSGKRQSDVIKPDTKTQDIFLCREILPGEFKRCFTLPSKINENKVDANLADGVLEVRLDKETPGKTMRTNMNSIKLK